MNEVSAVGLDKKFKKFEKETKNIAFKILTILNKNNVSVDINLTSSPKMRFLNKKFRGKNKTTSILSFEEPRNFISPPSRFKKLGEIYLNASSISPKARLARGGKYPASAEASAGRQMPRKALLVHGLLHLLGYTHKKKNDTIKMERKENLIISKI